MLIVNLIVIIIFFMLALLSRKHFSKYKNILRAMSQSIYVFLNKHFDFSKKRTDLRKLNVVSDTGLSEITMNYYTNIISICMVVIFVINLACMLLNIFGQFNTKKNSNLIERGNYDEGIRIIKIYADSGEDQSEYELRVYPRQYTEEEFNKEADKVFEELRVDILANNIDLMHIKSDLNLPSYDYKGRFDISWKSDYPEFILPSGKINFEELKQETEVNLVARIEYLDYSKESSFELRLIPNDISDESDKSIGVVLKQIEKNSRNSSSFEIPDEIDGKRISLDEEDGGLTKRLLMFGVIMCVSVVVFSNNNLNRKKNERDSMLNILYPSFVSRLSLLLGTGMNIKNCFINIISKSKKNILSEELEYTLNQIKSGYDEATAYEELGIRIGLPQYNRLMNHISQNLRMGTRDLRMLMTDEVKEAMEGRKEYAKKKGEKASTKLLFPMIVLMAVVIVIIMLPTFVDF